MLILDTGIFILIFILAQRILSLFRLTFRTWAVFTAIVLISLGVVAGIVQLLLQLKKKTCLTMLLGAFYVCAFAISVVMAWIVISGFVFWGLEEHVVERDGTRYVAHVYGLQHTTVCYYEYKNFFVEGNTMRIEAYYDNGGFDPIESKWESFATRTTYYDEYGNVVKEEDE